MTDLEKKLRAEGFTSEQIEVIGKCFYSIKKEQNKPLSEKEEMFADITQQMLQTFIKKNHDYGNSFDKSCDEFGVISAIVRMSDKMERLKSLCTKEAYVEESMLDTLADLANYSVMTMMWLITWKNRQ